MSNTNTWVHISKPLTEAITKAAISYASAEAERIDKRKCSTAARGCKTGG